MFGSVSPSPSQSQFRLPEPQPQPLPLPEPFLPFPFLPFFPLPLSLPQPLPLSPQLLPHALPDPFLPRSSPCSCRKSFSNKLTLRSPSSGKAPSCSRCSSAVAFRSMLRRLGKLRRRAATHARFSCSESAETEPSAAFAWVSLCAAIANSGPEKEQPGSGHRMCISSQCLLYLSSLFKSLLQTWQNHSPMARSRFDNLWDTDFMAQPPRCTPLAGFQPLLLPLWPSSSAPRPLRPQELPFLLSSPRPKAVPESSCQCLYPWPSTSSCHAPDAELRLLSSIWSSTPPPAGRTPEF
mmetsp:Transcript_66118/g.184119  ORF Transcript_66118/g.184119 Transcript_66118/m.184119 type:complete len:294 (+) Transcript_66118:812-1693(+)